MNIPSISASIQAESVVSSALAPRNQPVEKRSPGEQAPAGASGAVASGSLRPEAPAAAEEAKTTPLEQVRQAMEDVRNAIAPVAQDLLFSIDEDTGKTIVKVVDASTDEVIRQIPSEEIISIAKALDKLQGLLLEQKA